MPAKIKKEDYDILCEGFKGGNKIEVLSGFDEYKNLKTKLRCRCTVCGKEQLKTLGKLKMGQGCGERVCKGKKVGLKGRLSKGKYDERCRQHREQFDMLTLTEYKDFKSATSKIRLRCEVCGEEQDKRFADLTRYGCNSKACRNKDKMGPLRSEGKFDEWKNQLELKEALRIQTPFSDVTKTTDRVEVYCGECKKTSIKTIKLLRSGAGCMYCANIRRGNHGRKTKSEFMEEVRKAQRDLGISILTKYSEYTTKASNVNVECIKCGRVHKKSMDSICRGHGCRYCSTSGPSKGETEIYDLVHGLFPDTVQGDRTVLSGKEIDVYVPSKNIGIEYNGLYWHSEEYRDKKYHIDKWKKTSDNNIHLIQIFEDQWRDRRDIVESIIKNKLGLTENSIYARKTKVRLLESKEERSLAKIFMNDNHLDGHTNFHFAIGLFLNDEMVQCITVRKPFTSRYSGYYEIARLASRLDTVVIGGFSRLMKYVKERAIDEQSNGLLTYADLKLGTGKVYLDYGFEYIGDTLGEYWYTDSFVRYNRFKYRATKELTEKQVAEKNNVKKIYGVGSSRYILNF